LKKSVPVCISVPVTLCIPEQLRESVPV
jgi:hypothetical protein